MDDNDEDKLGPINNNPLSTLDELDEESDESAGEDGEDEASSTALSRTADGSDATTASPTALDRLVDGSNASPASTIALDLSVNVSNATREGEAAAAGTVGDNDTPVGNDATGDYSIPPMQQATLFCISNEVWDQSNQRQRLHWYETGGMFFPRLRTELGQLRR